MRQRRNRTLGRESQQLRWQATVKSGLKSSYAVVTTAGAVNRIDGIYGTNRSGCHTAFQMYGCCKPKGLWGRHAFALCVNGWTALNFLSRERDPRQSAAVRCLTADATRRTASATTSGWTGCGAKTTVTRWRAKSRTSRAMTLAINQCGSCQVDCPAIQSAPRRVRCQR
jgi:hypothetical protein